MFTTVNAASQILPAKTGCRHATRLQSTVDRGKQHDARFQTVVDRRTFSKFNSERLYTPFCSTHDMQRNGLGLLGSARSVAERAAYGMQMNVDREHSP